MASSFMHLAVTNIIADELSLCGRNRLRLGSILPDACLSSPAGHLKLKISVGTTYDLSAFRQRFGGKMLCDTLYMGYYIHLAEDLVYRDFVYNRYKWNPMENGRLSQRKVDGLHSDYRLLNKYIKEKYNLKNDIKIPHDIAEEELCRAFPMNVTDFMREFELYFNEDAGGETFFFTPAMADEYISCAAEICIDEYKSLTHGEEGIDEKKWAWNNTQTAVLSI